MQSSGVNVERKKEREKKLSVLKKEREKKLSVLKKEREKKLPVLCAAMLASIAAHKHTLNFET